MALLPALALVRVASWLLRSDSREEWQKEWAAEVWHRYAALYRRGAWTRRSALRLHACVLGCFTDAWYARSADDGRLRALRSIARSPWTSLLTLAAILLSIAGTTRLAATRFILGPLPSGAERLAIVTATGRLESVREGIPPDLADRWCRDSALLAHPRPCAMLRSSELLALWKPAEIDPPADRRARAKGAPLLVRLRSEADSKLLAGELAATAEREGLAFVRTAPSVLPLPVAVHSPLYLFAESCALAALLTAALVLPSGIRLSSAGALYLTAKTVLALAIVLVLGLEWLVGTSQSVAEPLGGPGLLWFYLMGTCAVLFLSLTDQKARCRVCLKVLANPVRMGSPGCLFLDWCGTELLCPEGHGMLYVTEHQACWAEAERWVAWEA